MLGENLSIFKKGLLLVAAPLLLQLVFVGLLLRMQSEATQAEQWALHTKEVMAQAQQVFALLAHAHAQARGTVASQDPAFAPELPQMRQQVTQELADLAALVHDNPTQSQKIVAFRATGGELLAWVDQVVALVREGRFAEAVARVRDRSGLRLLNSLDSQLQDFLDREQALDRQRLAAVASARTAEQAVLAGAAAVSIFLAAALLRLFGRSISARLAVLSQNARRLAERQPLETVTGRDELAQLDRAFHESAQRLAAAEQAERRYKQELERRATELDHLNQDLALRTQENETFVYSVSHDLRSPLVNLQGFSRELLTACRELRTGLADRQVPPEVRERLLRVLDGDVATSVRFIQTAVSRSSNIIDALLRLSRAGRVQYKWQPVDVRAIVDRVVDALHATIGERNVTCEIGELPPACGDPTAIEQIFANLIGNAVSYLDPARPGRIEIGCHGAAEGLRTYFVKDNGVGIPAEYLPKLFVAFQRLHAHLAEGEGIGLALVRRVVERHGGNVWVESTAGAGTTFYVSLPAQAPCAGAPAAEPAPAAV